mmetsp:Transcript_17808/g.40026  ORF Transcript_17808/g.40026 Transcript_17808/m.40026 type:complete len:126 (+) Transcript_17808:99-476(+)
MSLTGIARKWNEERGFGFISPDSGGDDLFCHATALMDGVKSLVEGDKVEFDEGYDERKGKTRADNVRVIGGGGGGGGRRGGGRDRSPRRRSSRSPRRRSSRSPRRNNSRSRSPPRRDRDRSRGRR